MAAGLPEGLAGRPLVAGLFVSSVLLSIVSWYTTQQGMALYLSSWFALLASLGVQSALVLVAWLVGVTEARRGLLVAVYAVTATVSVAFSYVTLHTWFAARERPAAIERRLYDALDAAASRAQELLTASVAEGRRHVLALEDMAAAEKRLGYVSRAPDPDPFLARVREAVAREGSSGASPEGEGAGLRHAAFLRQADLARQAVARLEDAQRALSVFRQGTKPLDPTEQQLRTFRQAFDGIPWDVVRESLHREVEAPAVPAYSGFVDRTASGQEDLVVAFTELLSAPTRRHVLALTLAAFIDLIVFLLAYASGPLFAGAPEGRWLRAGAALDAADEQVFARDLLARIAPSARGLARLEVAGLSPGQRQVALLLASRGLAVLVDEDGRRGYLLDAAVHRRLAESIAHRRLPLVAASAVRPAAG